VLPIVLLALIAGLAAGLTGTIMARRRLRRQLDGAAAALQRLQTSFGHFAPNAVIEGILARGVPSEAQRRDVTVLFADLVGFTALSESLDPEVLVAVLNDYFGRMSRVIGDHRGHLAKFIGDGLMALFGAFEPNPWQANDAVHAALAMQRAIAAYNEALGRRGLPALRVGIGIHRGPVIAGVIGSSELLEFTAIGHTVNLASRVERLTRTCDAAVLVTDDVRAVLDPRFVLDALEPRPVRGVAEPVATYAVRGFRE
jgi:adenylate cyclase